MPRSYVVYILSNPSTVLYIGVTGHLHRRLLEHWTGRGSRYVTDHATHRLVHVEVFARPDEAIRREKQLKRWNRLRKIDLILAANPEWNDLAEQWGWAMRGSG